MSGSAGGEGGAALALAHGATSATHPAHAICLWCAY